MKNILKFLFATFVCCGTVFAQTTTVTGTITDPDGTVWSNAKVTVTFVPNSNYPNINQYNIAGVAITNSNSPNYYQYLNQTVTTNGSGQFTVTLLDNQKIAPIGSSWYIIAQSNTAASASTFPNIQVTGATQDITSFITSNVKAPRFPALDNAFGYNDNEISVIPQPGGNYFNVLIPGVRVWNGISWYTLGAGTVSSSLFIDPTTYTGADLGAQINAVCTALGGVVRPEMVIPNLNGIATYTIATEISGVNCPSGFDLNLNGATLQGDGLQHMIFDIVGATPTINVATGARSFSLNNFRIYNGTITNGGAQQYAYDDRSGIWLQNVNNVWLSNLTVTGVAGTHCIGHQYSDHITIKDSIITNCTRNGVDALPGGQYHTYENLTIDNITTLVDNAYCLAVAGYLTNPVYLPGTRHVYAHNIKCSNTKQWESLDTHIGSDITIDGFTSYNDFFGAQIGNAPDLGVQITGYVTDTNGTQITYSYTNNTCGSNCPALTAPYINGGDEIEILNMTHSQYNTHGPVNVSTATYSSGSGTFTVKGSYTPATSFVSDATGTADRAFLNKVKITNFNLKNNYMQPGVWSVNSFTSSQGTYPSCVGPACAGTTYAAGTPGTITLTVTGNPPFQVGDHVAITYGANPTDSNPSALATAINAPASIIAGTVGAVNGSQITLWYYGGCTGQGRCLPNLSSTATTNQIGYFRAYGLTLNGSGYGNEVYNSQITNGTIDGYGFGYISGTATGGALTLAFTSDTIVNNIHFPTYSQNCINMPTPNENVIITDITCGDLIDAAGINAAGPVGFATGGNYNITLDHIHSNASNIKTAPLQIITAANQNNQMFLGQDITNTIAGNNYPTNFNGGFVPANQAVIPSNANFQSLTYAPGEIAYDIFSRPFYTFSCYPGVTTTAGVVTVASLTNHCTGMYNNDTTDNIALVSTVVGSQTINTLKSCQAYKVSVSSGVVTVTCGSLAPFAGTESGIVLENFLAQGAYFLNGATIALTSVSTVACSGVSSTNTCTQVTFAVPAGGPANYTTAPDVGTLGLGGAYPQRWLGRGMNISIPGAGSLLQPVGLTVGANTTGGSLASQTKYCGQIAAIQSGTYPSTALYSKFSAETCYQTLITPGATNQFVIQTPPVAGAAGYILAFGSSGAEQICQTSQQSGTLFTVNSAGSCSGGVPWTADNGTTATYYGQITNHSGNLTLNIPFSHAVTDAPINYVGANVQAASDTLDWTINHLQNYPTVTYSTVMQEIWGGVDSHGTTFSTGGIANLFNAYYTRSNPQIAQDNIHQPINTLPSGRYVYDQAGFHINHALAGATDAATPSFWLPDDMFISNTTANLQMKGSLAQFGSSAPMGIPAVTGCSLTSALFTGTTGLSAVTLCQPAYAGQYMICGNLSVRTPGTGSGGYSLAVIYVGDSNTYSVNLGSTVLVNTAGSANTGVSSSGNMPNCVTAYLDTVQNFQYEINVVGSITGAPTMRYGIKLEYLGP